MHLKGCLLIPFFSSKFRATQNFARARLYATVYHGVHLLFQHDLTALVIKGYLGENAPSNKNEARTKSMIMDIWVVGSLYALYIREHYTLIICFFKKNEVVSAKTPFLMLGTFCTPYSICLFHFNPEKQNSSFLKAVFVFKMFFSKLKC